MASRFEALCAAGEAADRLVVAGKPSEAVPCYRGILDEMFAAKQVDAFVAGKCVLGLMLALISANDPDAAGEVWLADQRGAREEIGLLALTQGQCTARDSIIYALLSGYFWGMSRADRGSALRSIDAHMGSALDHSIPKAPDLVPFVLHDWLFSLVHLFFPEEVPQPASRRLREQAARLGAPLPEVHYRATTDEHGKCNGFVADIRAQLPRPSPWRIDG